MERKQTTGRALFYMFPALMLIVLLFLWPILLTFYYSFTNLALTGKNAVDYHFVGFENFRKMFADPTFLISFWNTIVFLLASAIVGQLILGFLIALLMKGKNRNVRSFVGISVLIGWIAPEIIVSFCWIAFLSEKGSLNAFLQTFFHIKPIAFLYSFPMISVIIANIWHGTAYSMLQFQAALDDVPRDIEEAAEIDGAGAYQKLWYIIIPTVKNTILTDAVLITLQTLGVFGLIYTMTGGGPGNQTTTLSIFMYKQAFLNYQMGYGTSVSLILLCVGIVLSLLYMKAAKSIK